MVSDFSTGFNNVHGSITFFWVRWQRFRASQCRNSAWSNEIRDSACRIFERVTALKTMNPGDIREYTTFPKADILAGCSRPASEFPSCSGLHRPECPAKGSSLTRTGHPNRCKLEIVGSPSAWARKRIATLSAQTENLRRSVDDRLIVDRASAKKPIG